MGILDGIVEWIAEQVMNGLDLVTTSVLGSHRAEAYKADGRKLWIHNPVVGRTTNLQHSIHDIIGKISQQDEQYRADAQFHRVVGGTGLHGAYRVLHGRIPVYF